MEKKCTRLNGGCINDISFLQLSASIALVILKPNTN